MKVTSSNQTLYKQHMLLTHRSKVRNLPLYQLLVTLTPTPHILLHGVVCSIPSSNQVALVPPTLFSLEGAPNVILDTIKRGDDDSFGLTERSSSAPSIILRLYEAYGGHAQATLRMSVYFGCHYPSLISNLILHIATAPFECLKFY